jgi:hypothetical protein
MKMNSRMGRVLPDIDAFDAPFLHGLLTAIARLGTGHLTPEAFLAETIAVLSRAHLRAALAEPMARALSEQSDQVMHRKTLGPRDHTIQIIYIAPGEVHPPHVHHNVISTQLVLAGAVYAREYERVSRRDETTIMLQPLTEGCYRAGDAMQTTEFSRNAHWFAAQAAPALMLNFNVRGYHDKTFDPPGLTLGRRLIDPTVPIGTDGTIAAVELEPAEAYAKFGGRSLQDFPLHAAPGRRRPFVRIAL